MQVRWRFECSFSFSILVNHDAAAARKLAVDGGEHEAVIAQVGRQLLAAAAWCLRRFPRTVAVNNVNVGHFRPHCPESCDFLRRFQGRPGEPGFVDAAEFAGQFTTSVIWAAESFRNDGCQASVEFSLLLLLVASPCIAVCRGRPPNRSPPLWFLRTA